MNIRALLQVAPILFRHLEGYFELAEQDIAATKAQAVARLRVVAIFCVSALFMLLMLCVLVIALTWDTDYRVLAVALVGGFFTVVTVASGFYLAQLQPTEPFMELRREWRQDRQLIYRLISGDDENEPANASRIDQSENVGVN